LGNSPLRLDPIFFTTTIALSVVLCPLFLLNKGEAAEYKAGTEFEVFVDRDVTINLQAPIPTPLHPM